MFESLLAVQGRPRKVQAHLNRLAGSAAALDLTLPDQDAWRRAIETAITEFRSTHPAPTPEEDEVVVK
ncbi:aminotransferase class IV, partial [Pseudomonas sp. Pseusp11]|uniref:aminotransferase class IV n=1 Tax=Pseudomonas sp. Pseusp11 TaxID=3243003 RepID=UPI0039B4AE0C